MMRNALMAAASLFAAAGFVCAPTQTVPSFPLLLPAAAAGPASPRTAHCNDAASFFKRIAVLSDTYNPDTVPGKYKPPLVQTPPGGANNPYNLRAQIMTDLMDAYTNAPASFKTQLCALDGVYLSTTGCPHGDANNCPLSSGSVFPDSWGFRSHHASATDNGNRYIAISAALWSPGSSAMPFDQFEDAQLRQLVNWGPRVLSTNPPNPNSSWMTVLAALGHEFGHVHWADVNIPLRSSGPPAGGPYDFHTLQSCATGDFFMGWDYHGAPGLLEPKGKWRHFNDRANDAGQSPVDHVSDPTINQFDSGISADQKNDLFYTLYQSTSQPWASYFGSRTPDEDFVESFVLNVLTGASLTSMPVTLSYSNGTTKTADITSILATKTTLLNKIACIPP